MPAHHALPWRGRTRARPSFGLALPGERMPLFQGSRPLKRWRWIGCFGPEVMLCAARARVGPGRLCWWAVWDAELGRLTERASRVGCAVRFGEHSVQVADGEVRIDLELDPAAIDEVETVSRHGARHAWTRKRAGVPMQGVAAIGGRRLEVRGHGVIDDSAGYHARCTAWRWCAGVGVLETGARVGWNLVVGLHDDPRQSERSVWVEGVAHQVGPVRIAENLSGVDFAEGGALRFWALATRAHHERLGLVSSSYEQPFGAFAGTLPGAGRLREGWGVMERHEARW
jgi:hypothetical protein